jgi:hypothetical protein
MWKLIILPILLFSFQACRETESSVPAQRVVSQDGLKNLLSGAGKSEAGSGASISAINRTGDPQSAALTLKARPKIKYSGTLFIISWAAIPGVKDIIYI